MLSLFAALAVSGCSETGMQNLLGANKASDNEQMPVGQNLSMPPDLNLRPPAGGGSDDTNVAANAPVRPAASTEPADLKAVPPGDQEQQQSAMAAPQPQPQQAVQPVQPVAQPPAQDVYAKYGISKTDAQGKPKSEEALFNEVRAAKLAEKRKANPNYGTIWNLGNVFSDN